MSEHHTTKRTSVLLDWFLEMHPMNIHAYGTIA